MRYDNTRDLVEVSLLAALSAVLFMAGRIPVVGFFLVFLSSVPMVVMGVKFRIGKVFGALLVAFLLVSMLMGVFLGLGYALGFGVLGAGIGVCCRKSRRASEIVLAGGIISILSRVVLIGVLFGVFAMEGVNLANLYVKYVDQMVASLEQVNGLFEASGRNLEGMVKQVMFMSLPAMLILASFVETCVIYAISSKIIRRFGIIIPVFPSIKDWAFPKSVSYAFLFALFCIFMSRYFGETGNGYMEKFFFSIWLNLYIITGVLFMLQGVAVGAYFCKGNVFLIALLFVLAVLFPLFNRFAVLVGLADQWFNFRLFAGGLRGK